MRILIVKPSSLGDIIHAMVVVSAIRKNMPDVIIDWIVGDRFQEIVRKSCIADHVLVYQRYGGVKAFWNLLTEIRKQTYDYVFDMQGLARSALMTLSARSKNKIGRKDSRELAFLAYNKTVAFQKNLHAVDILREFLPLIGLPKQIDGNIAELNNIESPQYSAFISDKIRNEKFICLFPESRGLQKEWHFFEPLAELLLKETDCHVLYLGTKKQTAMPLPQNERFWDLRGVTNIADVVFLIQKAALVIANDSGPLHIAAASNVPVLGLFITTDAHRFGPYPVETKMHKTLTLKNLPSEIASVLGSASELLSQPRA